MHQGEVVGGRSILGGPEGGEGAGVPYRLDAADWAVTLGDTTGHDYAVLLCDSETLAVLGYLPIA
ncbi:hypothetical protein [Intestinimonas timonensis]|uniref:hypothetical protein n=1 Tax=Intestinimonas timonensis TaxID=1689270 RepID=UPI00103270AC|nr:hypothetical protein [Intestinimonas timonensis]